MGQIGRFLVEAIRIFELLNVVSDIRRNNLRLKPWLLHLKADVLEHLLLMLSTTQGPPRLIELGRLRDVAK